ncbi:MULTISPECIES: dual specificity protein phosphatase family protein [unclassified Sinorhizobium]|uniref:dual specificity protein phosphatase family protein n=1 Tax=unclassified Sinorhizobium TaxID=2613772 RepID=UPI00352429F4
MLKPIKVLRRKSLRMLAAVVMTLAAGTAVYLGYLQLTGNFHTVIAGELYRSAQLPPAQLEAYIRAKGIATIVNLRGENDHARWYADEVATAEKLGVKHIDFKMSATKILPPEKADQLVAILKAAPKPILIHCEAGADRSGLASVIYSERVAGINEDVAEHQLSILFGHIGIPYLSAAFAMDESWEDLERYFHVVES